MTIRTILVDDESLAIQGLKLRLQAHEDVEIIETCTNGREAIRAIKTHKPDLVFLDIQMPGFDGFSVVQGMMEVEPPLFIFVTAYSDHAIRAFEAQAVDYLMKPVDEGRLADALDRVRLRLSEKKQVQEAEKLREVLAEVAPDAMHDFANGDEDAPASNRFEKLINIKDRGQIFRVDVDSIELMKLAQEIGVQYLDTVVEPWPGFYFGSTLPNADRTNYPLRERVRELGKSYVGGPTAASCCPCGPSGPRPCPRWPRWST